MEKLILHISDLPKYLELHGKNGKKKYYKIMPAGRKFGAHLNAVNSKEKEFIKEKN